MALNLEWVDGFDLVNYSNVALKYGGSTGLDFGIMRPGFDTLGFSWDVGNTGFGLMFVGAPIGVRPGWVVNLSIQFKPNGDIIPPGPFAGQPFYPESYFLYAGLPADHTPRSISLLTMMGSGDPNPSHLHIQVRTGGDSDPEDPDSGGNGIDTEGFAHSIIWTSPFIIDFDHRYAIQLKFSYASGLIELWIDGVMMFTGTGFPMYSDPTRWALFHEHYHSFGNSGPSFDDWVVFSSDDNSEVLPLPMRVYSGIMDTDDAQVWTPSSGTDHFAMVNDHPFKQIAAEAVPDADATYLSSGGPIAADTFKTGRVIGDTTPGPFSPYIYFPVVPDFTKVYGIGVNATARTLAGTGILSALANGTDLNPFPLVYANGYGTNQWHSMVDPLTGLPWLAASIRAAKWGFRQTDGPNMRVTSFNLEIVAILGPPPPPPSSGAYIRGSGGFALAA